MEAPEARAAPKLVPQAELRRSAAPARIRLAKISLARIILAVTRAAFSLRLPHVNRARQQSFLTGRRRFKGNIVSRPAAQSLLLQARLEGSSIRARGRPQ